MQAGEYSGFHAIRGPAASVPAREAPAWQSGAPDGPQDSSWAAERPESNEVRNGAGQIIYGNI